MCAPFAIWSLLKSLFKKWGGSANISRIFGIFAVALLNAFMLGCI